MVSALGGNGECPLVSGSASGQDYSCHCSQWWTVQGSRVGGAGAESVPGRGKDEGQHSEMSTREWGECSGG